MIARLYRLAVLAAALMASTVLVAGEEILYWMVDDSSIVNWWNDAGEQASGTVSEFFDSFGTPEEGSAFAARIRVTGGDIQDGENVFLDLYIPGYGVDTGGGEYGVEFSNVGGYWGAGVPAGNESPSGDYAAGSPEYCFSVELGNLDSSDNWTTVAYGEPASYTSLGAYIHETFDLNPGQFAVWTPTTFGTDVPEPSSGLLLLIGGALLALRRKKATTAR